VKKVFSFPSPVNEVSARLVAAGVVIMAVLTLALRQRWVIPVMAYGFLARVLAGPTLSPLGQFVTRAVTPRLEVPPKLVPGPPKRFAQLVGLVFTATATVLAFAVHLRTAAFVLIGIVGVFAFLESALAFCMGCFVFNKLMKMGVIPRSVCEECANLESRLQPAN
jgi:hypothetical protein